MELPTVDQLWCDPKELTGEMWHDVYGRCRRGDEDMCINSNVVKAMAKWVLNRTVRFVRTRQGMLRWTERLEDGKSYRFIVTLDKKYVAMIDKYDTQDENFKVPTECPFGPVICLGSSGPRHKTTYIQPKTPRTKGKRELQLPYVLAREYA